ncbi:MAG: VCBS repeat-containing protein [bacterium]|nr:VCBS repeat-containing protein [bacterium]
MCSSLSSIVQRSHPAHVALAVVFLSAAPCFGNLWDSDCTPDVWAIDKHDTVSSQTEVHIVNGEDLYASNLLVVASALRESGLDHQFEFLLGDYDNDGTNDLYVIEKSGTPSGQTEVHILDGADFYRSFLLTGRPTALTEVGTDGSWAFQLADWNSDRILDLFAIEKQGRGSTLVHVLNGDDRFGSFLHHIPTTLAETGDDQTWTFLVGDYNSDGVVDLYALQRQGTPSHQTELYILDGASFFGSTLIHGVETTLKEVGSDASWNFSLAELNGDSLPELYAVQKAGTRSGQTEVFVLNGADHFKSVLLHGAKTVLPETGSDHAWVFIAGGCEQYADSGQQSEQQ